MLITHQREKLADAIIYFVKNTKYCGTTKLFKLLFFLDFIHFRETGKSVTGLEYVTWPKGPAPRALWVEIKEGLKEPLSNAVIFQSPMEDETRKLTRISLKRPYDGRFLTKRETRIMRNLSEVFLEATADQMVEVTHLKNSPWSKTLKTKGIKSKIDYWLAVDGSDARQLDLETLKAKVAEMTEARKALS